MYIDDGEKIIDRKISSGQLKYAKNVGKLILENTLRVF